MSRYIRKRKKIDYQSALLDITNSMVRLKQPKRLLKMITRFINREFHLSHTSLLVWEEGRNRFIFADSRGSRRFPVRLVKFDPDRAMFPAEQHFHLAPVHVRKRIIRVFQQFPEAPVKR